MLEKYRSKRRFAITPEPDASSVLEPSIGSSTRSQGEPAQLRFVVQKHAARRLHYDLRLEANGVLLSWAIPKGPSLRPQDKRLAVKVEDHPLEYADFEGTIPAGEYGAGEVEIWDRGTFLPERNGEFVQDRDEAQSWIRKCIESGKLSFTLHGNRLSGGWTLVHKNGDDWLLIKRSDESAVERDPLKLPTATPMPQGTIRRTQPRVLTPMIPTEVARPFSGDEWTFELKLDGIRALVFVENGTARILSRNGHDISPRFPGLGKEFAQLVGRDCIVDGEIVVFDDEGRPSFQGLMQRFSLQSPSEIERWDIKAPVDFVLFDLLWLDDADLRGCRLSDRKKLLESLDPRSRHIRVIDSFPGDGTILYEQALKLGLEGIVAKRLDSLYSDGVRSRSWLKVKGYHTEEFLVCGYTEGQGSRTSTFGALILGRRNPDGTLRHCGSVGAGFSDGLLASLHREFQAARIPNSPFPEPIETRGAPTWLRPDRYAEVRFMTWTKDGRVRAPSFVRMRDDLTTTKSLPSTLQMGGSSVNEADAVLEALQGQGDELSLTIEGSPIRMTHLSKVLWPGNAASDPITKRDLAIYFAKVADPLLRGVRDRPLSLVRFPGGITGKGFFQKHVERGLPDFVETVEIWSDHNRRSVRYLMANNLATLFWFAQSSVLEIHPWYSRIDPYPDATGLGNVFTSREALDQSVLSHPDFLVIDLDPHFQPTPGENAEPYRMRTWKAVVAVAGEIRGVLEALGLKSLLKTSGKAGLHIYVPISRDHAYPAVRAAAETLGEFIQKRLPDRVTMVWSVKKRPEGVFFDHNQNVRGKTLVAPYSPRAVEGAPVSFPLLWHELDQILPWELDILTAPSHLARRPDPWAHILDLRQPLLTGG